MIRFAKLSTLRQRFFLANSFMLFYPHSRRLSRVYSFPISRCSSGRFGEVGRHRKYPYALHSPTGDLGQMTASLDEILTQVESLSRRVAKIELLVGLPSSKIRQLDNNIDHARIADDPYGHMMVVKALAAGFARPHFVRCAPDYYTWTLEQRRRHLSSPSTDHLCKSIVLCNSRCVSDVNHDRLYSKYYCVVVQYSKKLKAEDLVRVLKKLNLENGRELGNKNFNFRLAEDCEIITGYPPNAVTPLSLKTPMPVVLDREITQLQPGMFWMGGGKVDLKWRVDLAEFISVFEPIICDVTPDTDLS
jgi:prolyl-tRNA editing enzyme YbaK/EbsC (Cys-tRNA(Pro) deacylase)